MSPSPEYDLLLDAICPREQARTDFTGWDGQSWGHVLNSADWHRLSPALFCHLQARTGAPPAVLSALERAYLANTARSLYIRTAIERATAALSAVDIPAMLLKGSALIETVYADPARREMLDIDLLVPAERMAEARAALLPLGYRDMPASKPSPSGNGVRVEAHHDQALIGSEQVLAIELHRHVAIAGEGRNFDLAGFWGRSRTLPSTGHLAPSAEDLLIHVCFHFVRNRLGGSARRRNTGGALAQIADIQQLVLGESIDWETLGSSARAWGLAPRVFLGLFAARELGVPVPAEVVTGLEPSGFDRELGRRLVALRVLRSGDHLPVRSLRWMFAPSREALQRGWNADPTATLSLARAYMRRARSHLPEARSALRRPWVYVQDQRLNDQLLSLEDRV